MSSESNESRKNLTESLKRIQSLLHSILDPTELTRALVAEAAQSMGSDAAAVSLRINNNWKFKDAVGFVSGFIGAELTDIDSPYSYQAIATREVVIVHNVSSDPKIVHQGIRDLGVTSTLLAPMFIQD